MKPEDAQRKIDECELALEYAEIKGEKSYIVVVRIAKKILLQGSVNAKVSRSRKLEEKA